MINSQLTTRACMKVDNKQASCRFGLSKSTEIADGKTCMLCGKTLTANTTQHPLGPTSILERLAELQCRQSRASRGEQDCQDAIFRSKADGSAPISYDEFGIWTWTHQIGRCMFKAKNGNLQGLRASGASGASGISSKRQIGAISGRDATTAGPNSSGPFWGLLGVSSDCLQPGLRSCSEAVAARTVDESESGLFWMPSSLEV